MGQKTTFDNFPLRENQESVSKKLPHKKQTVLTLVLESKSLDCIPTMSAVPEEMYKICLGKNTQGETFYWGNLLKNNSGKQGCAYTKTKDFNTGAKGKIFGTLTELCSTGNFTTSVITFTKSKRF